MYVDQANQDHDKVILLRTPANGNIALGCRTLISDPRSRILLFKHRDNGKPSKWALPGGRVEEKETLALAATRRLHEQFGVLIWPHCIVCVSDHIDPENRTHHLSIIYTASILSGDPLATSSSKVEEVRWFLGNEVPSELTIDASDALKSRQSIAFSIR